MPDSTGTFTNLNADIQRYLGLSIAASTNQTYSSGEKQFLDFCQLYRPTNLPMFPANEELLMKFVAYLALSIKHSSIKCYLAAVRHLHIRMGYKLDLTKFVRLQLVCRRVKRSQGDHPRVRLPITIHHLHLFYALLAVPYTKHFDSLMVWAAMTLAFFGFLRLGELTCNSKFSPEIHLAPRDVRFFPHQGNPDFMTLGIKASKTDPFRSGHTITIGKTGLPLCPISAMQKYLQARDTSSGPLFIYSSGTPLTKTALVSETRALLSRSGFNASHYAGHSYRIGAATTATSAGLPAWLIKTWLEFLILYYLMFQKPSQKKKHIFSPVSYKVLNGRILKHNRSIYTVLKPFVPRYQHVFSPLWPLVFFIFILFYFILPTISTHKL